jgi:fused signal recognition particle receptor
MLAACDTFRAAAIDQLQRWGERLEVPVIAQQHGSDAAAVAHDALQAARARGMDVLIIDSAGRQHVNADLMEQLSKVARVITRLQADAPHDVWLTVDAGNGQNVLSQIEHFSRAVSLTGLCVTKLDGTARGGVLLAVAQRFDLAVPFIGVGEKPDDLRHFEATAFAEALLEMDDDGHGS